MKVSLKDMKKRIERIPFIFILLAVAIFFWINGPAFFENWASTYGNTIVVYISMLLIFLFFAKKKVIEETTESLGKSTKKYITGFFATFVLMTSLSLIGLIEFGKISPDMVWQTLIVQMCIVSAAEELMFRGVLLSYVGIIASSALFAIWHSYAYGLTWYNLPLEVDFSLIIIAFVFACVLGWLVVYQKKRFGLVGAVACHACYNLCILGVLAL